MNEESAWATISLHRTKEGAENAKKKHKTARRKEWKKERKERLELFGDDYKNTSTYNEKFGRWEDWIIKEMEVLP